MRSPRPVVSTILGMIISSGCCILVPLCLYHRYTKHTRSVWNAYKKSTRISLPFWLGSFAGLRVFRWRGGWFCLRSRCFGRCAFCWRRLCRYGLCGCWLCGCWLRYSRDSRRFCRCRRLCLFGCHARRGIFTLGDCHQALEGPARDKVHSDIGLILIASHHFTEHVGLFAKLRAHLIDLRFYVDIGDV